MTTTRDLSNIRPGTTKCSVCYLEKDNRDFSHYRTRLTSDGYRLMTNTNCISCQRKLQKERASIKKKFKNIKPPAYGTPCEACDKPVYRNWQLDHCHDTGEFRGWTCKECNTGMGLLGDTVESLEKRILYLKRANARNKQNSL